MITLWAALQASSWQLIITIGRQRGLGLDANLSKSELMTKVAPTLLDPVSLSQTMTHLPTQSGRALLYLCQTGGHCPARYLRQQHGHLRPMSQLVQRRQRLTAQSDLSLFAPLEQLCLLGLVFLDRKTDDLFIPSDLMPLIEAAMNNRGHEGTETRGDEQQLRLPSPRLTSYPCGIASLPLASPVDLLCHDLTCLLALLQREDIAPLPRRWLPSYFLADWGQNCAVSPASPKARSELQTHRRRFLHYLAENVGWLGDQVAEVRGQKSANHDQQSAVPEPNSPYGRGGFALGGPKERLRSQRSFLKPAPAAWLWLQANRDERLQRLWQTWVTPQPELWRAYRLPGHDWLADPARLLAPLHQALTELDPADPARFGQMLLARSPALLDLVPANLVNPAEALVEAIEQLLIGPLVWLGMLSKDEFLHPSSLRLTPQGQAWLTGQPLADDLPPYAKFSLKTDFQPDVLDSALTLTLEDDLPEPIDLMVAIEVSEEAIPQGYDETREDEEVRARGGDAKRAKRREDIGAVDESLRTTPYASRPTLHVSRVITAASFIKALHRGWSPPALLDTFNQLANRSLTGQEATLLRIWAEAAGRMSIHHATLLETTDPGIITRLASTRRGRTLIQRTLSPRVVVVDSARLDQLVRRLTEQEGVPPQVQGRLEAKHRSSENEDNQRVIASPPPRLTGSDAAHLWLSLQVYQRLSRLIRLPIRTPQTLLDQIAGLAGITDLAVAEIAADQALAELQQVVEGRAIFPPWPEGSLPVEESLPVIEEALATGQNLQLLYYTAGADRLTRRTVEPYRVEWRGSGAGEQKIVDSRWKIEDSNPKSKIQNRKSGIPYLVGFCYHAQAERVFRVDRIQAITLVPRPDEDGQLWGE